eukprot:1144524-Pelagomonas_calceolata.AAC.2
MLSAPASFLQCTIFIPACMLSAPASIQCLQTLAAHKMFALGSPLSLIIWPPHQPHRCHHINTPASIHKEICCSHCAAPANLPSIFRPVGAQPFLALSRQSSLKSSISTGTLGDGSPHLQKQPSFARQPMKERSTAPAAAAGAAKHPSKPQVADAMSSVLQGS